MSNSESLRVLIRKVFKEHIKADGVISSPERLIDKLMLELDALPNMERIALAAENRALWKAYKQVTR